MDINQIIKLANVRYPGGVLDAHWNWEAKKPRINAAYGENDTLALFIVREISETYDPDASDLQQMAEAYRVILRGISDMESVADELFKKLNKLISSF
jgi:hypothetical protein